MGIRWKDPYMEKKWFESRFRALSQLWAWFMRRRGYDTNYMVSHLGVTKYLVRAGKEAEKNEE